MDILVRLALPADAEAIVGILNPIIKTGLYTALDSPFSVEYEREYITSFPKRGMFHVAENRVDRQVIGLQTLEPFADYTHAFDHVGVMSTFVDLELRRRGIGARLFAATLAAAQERGFEKIFTFVRADNVAALASYQKQGFRIVGTAQRQAKINGNYVDEIIIERFL